MSDNRLVKIFSGNLWQAQLVQGQLKSNGIECILENDTLSAVTSPYATLGGCVWVLVSSADKERAEKIMADNSLEGNPFN